MEQTSRLIDQEDVEMQIEEMMDDRVDYDSDQIQFNNTQREENEDEDSWKVPEVDIKKKSTLIPLVPSSQEDYISDENSSDEHARQKRTFHWRKTRFVTTDKSVNKMERLFKSYYRKRQVRNVDVMTRRVIDEYFEKIQDQDKEALTYRFDKTKELTIQRLLSFKDIHLVVKFVHYRRAYHEARRYIVMCRDQIELKAQRKVSKLCHARNIRNNQAKIKKLMSKRESLLNDIIFLKACETFIESKSHEYPHEQDFLFGDDGDGGDDGDDGDNGDDYQEEEDDNN
eukprot:403357371